MTLLLEKEEPKTNSVDTGCNKASCKSGKDEN